MMMNCEPQHFAKGNERELVRIERFKRISLGLHTVYLDPEIPFWFVPSPSGDKRLSEIGIGAAHNDAMDNFMRLDGMLGRTIMTSTGY